MVVISLAHAKKERKQESRGKGNINSPLNFWLKTKRDLAAAFKSSVSRALRLLAAFTKPVSGEDCGGHPRRNLNRRTNVEYIFIFIYLTQYLPKIHHIFI